MTNSANAAGVPGLLERARRSLQTRLALTILIGLHIATYCASLFLVSTFESYIKPHIPYIDDRLPYAIIVIAAFSCVAWLFVLARFSFGYFTGFYLYTMMVGFLWLDNFTKHQYDHKTAGWSAAASMVLFLLPAVLITAPVRQIFTLSPRSFERLLTGILALAFVMIAIASTYNFRLTSLERIYDFRDEIQFPVIIRYLIGIVSSALLPFAFACFFTLGQRWKAGLTLLLLLSLYPVTLSKMALFAPVWMIGLLVLSKMFEARITTVLSLFLPILIGFVAMSFFGGDYALLYFKVVNIRMIAIPSIAMDIYNDFFATHPLTHFCQISILKPLIACPYQEQLGVVLMNTYDMGNFNASLFATEGIASVGLYLAPFTALACGLVIAIGNRLSAGLPSRFILLSAAMFPHVLLNIPLSTALLSQGAGLLFLLWYVTPRAMFGTGGPATAFVDARSGQQ